MMLEKLYRALGWLTYGLFVILPIWFGLILKDVPQDRTTGVAFQIALLLFLVLLFVRAVLRVYAFGEIWSAVAREKSLTRFEPNSYKESVPFSPVLTGGATQWSTRMCYTDTASGLYVSEVEVTYGSGSASSFRTGYIVTSLRIANDLPHIFIDGLRRNSFRRSTEMWALNKKLSPASKIIDLEGDFYKLFDVYAVNSGELNALTIVTPDVMLEMRDKGYDFDYEIFSDRLYIIRDAKLKDRSDLRAFIDAARTCSAEFSKQLSGHHFTETAEQLPLNSPEPNAGELYIVSAKSASSSPHFSSA